MRNRRGLRFPVNFPWPAGWGVVENFARTARRDRLALQFRPLHWGKTKNPAAPGSEAGSGGGLGQREMAITQGNMPFVFGMVVLANLLIAAPVAQAARRSPKNICKHFDDCLQRTSDPNNKDAEGIRAGVKARNGQIELAGAEACARDLGKKTAMGQMGAWVFRTRVCPNC